MTTSAAAADGQRLRQADRQANTAATVLSLTLPGDVLLYVLLPLHAGAFGVSLPEAGVLLAANRLVRILGYGWIARYFVRNGPRRTCTLATIGAGLSTLGYGLLSGLWALLVARLMWGLSFAAMNISTQVLATSEPVAAARRSGRSRAIVSIGPMVALLAGAGLSEIVAPQSVFLLLGAIAFVALAFTPRLAGRTPTVLARRPRLALPTRLDMWSFVQGLTLDGLFVIGLAVLASSALPDGAALATGAALALRYLTEMLLSPVGGAAAERWGPARMLVVISLGCASGLVLVGCGALWLGALTVVVMRGALQPLAAPVVALRYRGSARVGAIASVATWRDLGAGVGPLIAGALIPAMPAWALYGAAALMLGAAAGAVGTERGSRSRP
ncbi:MAG: MFS transporter [Betaproteobacteria bacterium]|nr:MAG: MFS transporter [Betaproteobacteria bacterium]